LSAARPPVSGRPRSSDVVGTLGATASATTGDKHLLLIRLAYSTRPHGFCSGMARCLPPTPAWLAAIPRGTSREIGRFYEQVSGSRGHVLRARHASPGRGRRGGRPVSHLPAR